MHGVARVTIDRAIAHGEIVLETGGGIDPEEGAKVWLARRKRRQLSADLQASRLAAELDYTQARLQIERIKNEKESAACVDHASAQATIDGVFAAAAEAIEHFGEDEEDPKMRACLQAVREHMRRDLADLLPLAARVTQLDGEPPPKPLAKKD
jgi:hypothetical protein